MDNASHTPVWNQSIENKAMIVIRSVLSSGCSISVNHTYGFNMYFDHSEYMIQFDIAKRHFFMSTKIPFTYWMVHSHPDEDKAEFKVITDKVEIESFNKFLEKIDEAIEEYK